MKTFHLAPLIFALTTGTILAAPPDSGRDDLTIAKTIPTGTAGDGFFMRGPDAMVIRSGVIAKMNTEIVLSNGLRVSPQGDVTLRDGGTASLQTDRLLTVEGIFVDLTKSEATALAATGTKKSADKDVGISGRDGITVSGTDVLVTRNGLTERVTSDLRLPGGVVARADGTIVLANGNKIHLRADQVLDLKGVLHEAPVRPNPPGEVPSSNNAR